MANVYIEQYRNALRDDGGAVISAPSALMPNGSEVIVSSGAGGTLELEDGAIFLYVRAAGDCYGGFTNDPDDLDNAAALGNKRYDLQNDVGRWIAVNGTHFSAILKADA